MTTLTEAKTAQLPRVNLLPPEIAAAAKLRRLQMLLVLVVLGALAVSGLLFMWASGQVGQAEEDLADAEAIGAQREAEVASYSKVPEVLAARDAAQANLVQAMAPEVRWSFFLNDLSLTIPTGVRLSGLTATNAASNAQVAPGLPAVSPLGQPTMGLVDFQGKAKNYDAAAAWLQSLLRQDGFAEASASSIVLSEEEDTVGRFYNFTTSTYLTPEAASNRFLQITEGDD